MEKSVIGHFLNSVLSVAWCVCLVELRQPVRARQSKSNKKSAASAFLFLTEYSKYLGGVN